MPVRWVRREQYHLTVKFLGEFPEDRLALLSGNVRAVLKSLPEFSMTLGGWGTFPEKGPPRLLWIGTPEGEIALHALADCVESACAKFGIAKEKRPFNAHLTVGRLDGGGTPHRLRALLETWAPFQIGPLAVTSVALFKSQLTPTGPKYSILERFTFKSHL